MKNGLIAGGLMVLLATACTAHARPSLSNPAGGGYVGGSALMWELDAEDSQSLEANGFQFRFGNRINEYAAIESRFGLGGSDSTDNVKLSLDLLGSLLISPRLPVTDQVELYGAFGFSTFRGTLEDQSSGGLLTSNNSGTSRVSETDLTYGAGIALRPTEAFSIDADYMVYLDQPYYDFTGVSLGLTYYY